MYLVIAPLHHSLQRQKLRPLWFTGDRNRPLWDPRGHLDVLSIQKGQREPVPEIHCKPVPGALSAEDVKLNEDKVTERAVAL